MNVVKTIACIPAFNEELRIASVAILSREYGKVVVVDDGSADSTAKVAKATGAKVIRHEKNMGYGAAINTCLETGLKEKSDALVIIDGDGQHDPADIPKLLKALGEGFDVVVGSRFLSENDIPRYRKAGISALNTMTNLGSGAQVSDTQSGFRAYNKKALKALVGIKNSGMGAGSEILVKASDAGLKIAEVPIKVRYLDHASKRNALLHGFTVTTALVDMIRLRKPFAFFGLIGLASLLIGGLFGLYTLDLYNVNRALPFGPTIITVFFLLTGMLSIFSALILDSLNRIVDSRKEEG
ncbi:MAG: glycosyltransferase family 2 protein [Candidatus Micrarchaeota archaeon]